MRQRSRRRAAPDPEREESDSVRRGFVRFGDARAEPRVGVGLGADAGALRGTVVRVPLLGIEHAGLRVVGELEGEDVLDLGAEFVVVDREGDLDAAVEVAVHPVGRGQEELGVAAVIEAVDAGVFEEAVHDAPCLDVLAEVRDAGRQPTEPADEEANVDAGRARLVEPGDDGVLFERVHLERHLSRPAGRGVFDLALDPFRDALE